MNQDRMTRLFRFYAGAYNRIADTIESATDIQSALARVAHWQERMRKIHVNYK